LACLEKRPFGDFFRAYYSDLRAARIFPDVLKLLAGTTDLGNGSGRRDLITCAAYLYATSLFGRDGRPYFLEDVLNGDTTPLEEITFNATDFRTGLAFRFQKSGDPRAFIGNWMTRLPRDEAGRVRLGDVVASSSCFPAGFEPLAFPGDLGWQSGKVPPHIAEQFAHAPSPLMDGGVYDNQGFESLSYSDDRWSDIHKAPNGVDLLIISDTDRRLDSLYQMPPPVRETILKSNTTLALKLLCWINPRLKWLDWGSQALAVLCVLVVAAIGVNLGLQLFSSERPGWLSVALTSVAPALLAAGTFFAVRTLRGFIQRDLLTRIPQLQSRGWEYLREVPLGRTLDLVALRVTSLLALTSNVFMKRIRSAGLDRAFTDPAYKGRLMASFIYHLSPRNRWVFEDPAHDDKMLAPVDPSLVQTLQAIPRPSQLVLRTTERAAEVPTLLWFRDDDELPLLVAAGQITTCFNLIKFVARTRVFDPQTRSFPGEVGRLWQTLLQDWQTFQGDPRSFLRQIIPDIRDAADTAGNRGSHSGSGGR
jgi:hypothetical protein